MEKMEKASDLIAGTGRYKQMDGADRWWRSGVTWASDAE